MKKETKYSDVCKLCDNLRDPDDFLFCDYCQRKFCDECVKKDRGNFLICSDCDCENDI